MAIPIVSSVGSAARAMGAFGKSVGVRGLRSFTSEIQRTNKTIVEFTQKLRLQKTAAGYATVAGRQLGEHFGQLVARSVPAESVMGKVTAALSALGPKGRIAALVLQVLTIAISATVGQLYEWAKAAIAVTEQRSALVATFEALGTGAGQGVKSLAILDKLAAKLPFTVAQMSKWATSLMQARVQGAHLGRAIKATAAAQAMLGEGGASAAQGMIERLYKTRLSAIQTVNAIRMRTPEIIEQFASMGLRIEDVTKELGILPTQLRGTKISADQMAVAIEHALMRKGAGSLVALSTQMSTMWAKMKEGFSSIFEGVSEPVKRFQEEIYSLFTEFWKGSATMNAAKGVMSVVLTHLFRVATTVVHGIHKGFLYAAIGALKLAIAVAPIVLWFRKLYSNAYVLQGLKILLIALATPLVLLVGLAATLAAGFVAAVTVVSAVLGVLVAAVGATAGVLAEWVSSAYDAAANWIAGLVEKIKAGAGLVVDAVKYVAKMTVQGFASFMQSRSPSRKMMLQGAYVAQGAAKGIETGAPMVKAASARLAGGASEGFAPERRGGGGGTVQVRFEPGSIVVDGAGKSALEITEEMIALVFERIAAAQGLVVRST